MLSDAIFSLRFGLCSHDSFTPALCHLLMKVASFLAVTCGGRLRKIQTLMALFFKVEITLHLPKISSLSGIRPSFLSVCISLAPASC